MHRRLSHLLIDSHIFICLFGSRCTYNKVLAVSISHRAMSPLLVKGRKTSKHEWIHFPQMAADVKRIVVIESFYFYFYQRIYARRVYSLLLRKLSEWIVYLHLIGILSLVFSIITVVKVTIINEGRITNMGSHIRKQNDKV